MEQESRGLGSKPSSPQLQNPTWKGALPPPLQVMDQWRRLISRAPGMALWAREKANCAASALGADAGLYRGLIWRGGGLGSHQIRRQGLRVIDLDRFCGARSEVVIDQVMGGGCRIQARKQVDEGGFEGIGPGVLPLGQSCKALGLAQVIAGF